MKIQYLAEAYIKTVDKLKARAENRLTADDIRKDAKKIAAEPILTNREFLLKCGNCFKYFIHVNANSTPPGVLDFRFVDLKDGELTVICDAHYTGNATERNRATAKSILIEDAVINKYSVGEMSNEIDMYVTKYLWQYFKKHAPEVLDNVQKIHIEKINLWANTPESVNGVFPGKLAVRIQTEFYGEKILSEAEVSNLFDKVSELFNFCAKEVVLEKEEIIFKDTAKNTKSGPYDNLKTIVDNLIYLHNNPSISNRYQGVSYQFNDKFDSASLKQLSRKDLSMFIPINVSKKIDLISYLKTRDLEGSVINSTENEWANKIRIITTATQKEIDSISDKLGIYLRDGIHSAGTQDMPSPKTGFIEYVAVVSRYFDSFNDYWKVKDYIDGSAHNSYKLNTDKSYA